METLLYLLKDIELVEKVQRHTTKFILSDYTLQTIGLAIWYVAIDAGMFTKYLTYPFFIKSLKTPTDKFNILNYVSFNTGSTRSSGTKLHHNTAH